MNALKGTLPFVLHFILIVIILVFQSFELNSLFMYDRQAILVGEFWRFITAHFVHLSWEHTFLNVLGLLFCGLICKNIFRGIFLVELLYLSLGISLLLWTFNPEITDYVGFSGVLYGLFLLGIWSQRKDKYMFVMLVVIVLWAMWQWQMGGAAAEEALIGGNIVGIAHIYGLLLAFIWLVLKKYYLMIRMLF